MATYIAAANGNLTAGATWAAVDSTSLLDSQADNTLLTTALVASSTFTPGAITIDGIAVKVASRAASPSGTMTVELSTGGSAVAGTSVTINVSDLPAFNDTPSSTLCGIGWTFFQFAAPVLLLGATLYSVRASTSVVSQVNLFRDGTSNNWSRMLRTTTTGVAPTTGDRLFILGEWTAPATKTDRTVTMNSTAATDYGDGDTNQIATFGISNGGTLTFGTTAATNYILRISGPMAVWRGGTLNIGTSGTPMPRDSSGILEFDATASAQFGLDVHGVYNSYGQSRTSGKNVVWCLLNTDEAVAQTVLGVDTDTGWLSGDEIAIASTTRTSSEHEQRTLGANATATTLTVSAGLTNAHLGTAPTQAEVILLTRNVKVRSTTTSFNGFFTARRDSVVNAQWTEFKSMGSTGGRFAIWHTNSTSGTNNFQFCSWWEAASGIGGVLANWKIQIEHSVFYKVPNSSSDAAIFGVSTLVSPGDIVLNDLVIMGGSQSSAGCIHLADGCGTGASLTNLRCNSSSGAGLMLLPIQIGFGDPTKCRNAFTISDLHLHSNAAEGLSMRLGTGLVIADSFIWRNNSALGGMFLGASSPTQVENVVFDTCTIFGNGSSSPTNITIATVGTVTFRSCIIASDTAFATSIGVFFNNARYNAVRFENCDIGVADGLFTTHSTGDICYPSTYDFAGEGPLYLVDTVLGSTNKVVLPTTNLNALWTIHYQRENGVAGSHRTVTTLLGEVARDATTFRTAVPSERLTPSVLVNGLRLSSGSKRIAVQSGQTATVTVYVQKDGAYTGSQPRLRVRANPSVGVDDDATLDTMSGGSGSWEQLTGIITPAATDDGVCEVYVDCNGSAGNVYIDDWSVSLS